MLIATYLTRIAVVTPNVEPSRADYNEKTKSDASRRNLPPILLTPGWSCQLLLIRRWRHVVER